MSVFDHPLGFTLKVREDGTWMAVYLCESQEEPPKGVLLGKVHVSIFSKRPGRYTEHPLEPDLVNAWLGCFENFMKNMLVDAGVDPGTIGILKIRHHVLPDG